MRRYIGQILFYILLLNLCTYSQTPLWEFLGLDDKIITNILISDSNHIFVAVEPGAVYKSTDSGSTWIQKSNGITATTGMALDIDSEGSIYLAALGGVFKSVNGGENWFRIAQNLSDLEFIEIKVIPNDYEFVSNFNGIHRSTDRGQTWVTTDYTLFGAMEIGINSNGVMFAGNITASNFSIFRSTNLGENWTLAGFLATEAFLFTNNGDVFAGVLTNPITANDIYKSTDNGMTWSRTNVFNHTGTVGFREFEVDYNGDFYVAITGNLSGVYLSTDAGVSWSNYSFSLPTKCLAIDSSGFIYAGTNQQGIFRAPGRTVPVELISFIAEVSNKNVILSWITATEINNYGFEIERKQSGVDWAKIGFIQGNGTTIKENIYNYADENIETGEYYYRLKQIDYDGSFEYSTELEVVIEIFYDFNLEQNYPNPFNPGTSINYSIREKGLVNLKVFDILGKEVAVLINENQGAGNYSVQFNASNLPSGIYFYKITLGNYTATKKLILLK